MISLCMDTAYQNLVVGIYKDNTLVAGTSKEAFKKQSETIFVELDACLKKAHLDYADIDRIVITEGPGSYTGIRIAITIAKVLCTQLHIQLCCISTMQLYAGKDKQCNVLLDARSNRAYVAHVENGTIQGNTEILELDDILAWLEKHPGTVYGDGHLIGLEDKNPDFLKNFIDLEPNYRHVENIHALVPQYLKESDAYKA